MNRLNRFVTLSTTAIASLNIGVAVGSNFSFPSANAVTPSANPASTSPNPVSTSFVQTGSLSLPGRGSATRIVDNEYGIVCYMSAKSGSPLGCAKR